MDLNKLMEIRAQLDVLKKAEAELVADIKAQGVGKYEDLLYVATVYDVASSSSPDPKKMEIKLRELGVDDRWFSKNQKVRAGYTALRVTHK